MDDQPLDILERIHASYYQFTAAERKVADYILTQRTQVQFMSITQLAEECGTAEATISRFCRSLQLKGFNAFKIELARQSASGSGRASDGITGTLSGRNQEIARQATDAIQQTLELMDQEQVGRAVQLLEEASHVVCIGTGGSMIMANECAHMFSTVSRKFSAVADSHMQMSATATMDPSDVIILFSYSGATNNGLQVLELARARGIRTVLVTRFPKSPAAKLATVVLQCGSNEGPFQFGSVPAKIAQLIVVDVLFHEYYSRRPEECEQAIQSIASALSNMHV